MTSRLETVTLIGGPRSLVRAEITAGLRDIEFMRPRYVLTATGEALKRGMQGGRYWRIAGIDPPVFLWMGWK